LLSWPACVPQWCCVPQVCGVDDATYLWWVLRGVCPGLLAPRRTTEKAFVAVVQEAYIQAMGMSGIFKSQVSRLCQDIDERGHAFQERALECSWPYLWLDVTCLRSLRGCTGGMSRGGSRHGRQPRGVLRAVGGVGLDRRSPRNSGRRFCAASFAVAASRASNW